MSRNVGEGRPAATVVIVRDMPGSPPHILMMERAATMAFAGGALVFPGGAVDAADRALATGIAKDGDADDMAARIAAIRETLEESGLGIGFTTPPAPAQLMDMRAALAAGESLAAIADAHGLEFALDQLVPFSRWHPAAAEHVTRIFDTRFYLVRAPRDQTPSVDATENVRLFWSAAGDTIARCDAGQGRIIFPTRRNLERLALFDSFDAMAAHASSTPIEMVRPWIEDRAGQSHPCIPENIGYPVTAEPLGGVRRG
ncbi:NUDIX hydrolase [Sphingobium vermicomposti]|uniref:8-oxo-dGTP pyrophosphatase MutT (NUDIX family) n=1 Tax=Sphingobium vermicomposti TaxID=529005 RepID=A0A846M1V3_9SPHN|nr:NUDIX domain-containing protein [Sphingobium vermicomposti]NIJ16137.1 8-oxo-dGTP pyrophosphatase MutT (NUDIX family) [Sphingobium vermicomposti]